MVAAAQTIVHPTAVAKTVAPMTMQDVVEVAPVSRVEHTVAGSPEAAVVTVALAREAGEVEAVTVQG